MDKPRINAIFQTARNENRTYLMEHEVKSILKEYGIAIPREKVCKDVNESKQFAKSIGFPVVMKIVSPQIIHKSDVGGVKVGIDSKEAVEKAFEGIVFNAKKNVKNTEIIGVSVQEMAKGREVIIGVNKDSQFGHMIMFGLGGIFVEILKDVSFRLTPLEEIDAREMIEEIKAYPLLKGARGEKSVNIGAIEEILIKISNFVEERKEISEMDLNPVIVNENRAVVADARIIL
ncbi:MAG: acetate--CoA ligase family protein [Candidatus Methanofastidiosia archaeon]